MSGLATPGDHLLQPSFRLIVILIKVIPRRALPTVESRLLYRRTNRRPGLCYPAKDQQELAAECRRLKSMLVQLNVRHWKLVPALADPEAQSP
jgi:hypothetical protein